MMTDNIEMTKQVCLILNRMEQIRYYANNPNGRDEHKYRHEYVRLEAMLQQILQKFEYDNELDSRIANFHDLKVV